MLVQDPNTQEILIYKGWEETLKYVEEYIAANGPFDGFWAFSQVLGRLHLVALYRSLAAQLCLLVFALSLGACVSHSLWPVLLGPLHTRADALIKCGLYNAAWYRCLVWSGVI